MNLNKTSKILLIASSLWYFGEGFPTLDIVYWQQNDTLSMNVHQTTSASITPLFKMKMEYKICNGND